MPEKFQTHPVQEERLQSMRPHYEYMLHGQAVEVDLSGPPLIDKDQAVKDWGYNGAVMALIALPSGEESKIIAVVDYGEPDGDSPKPTSIMEGQPVPFFGLARTRFGLRAFNYTPDSHMATHVDVPESATIVLGRENGDRALNHDANYKLGLSDYDADRAISRDHATLEFNNGRLIIKDHSKYGSLVFVPRPEAVTDSEHESELQSGLGRQALTGTGYEGHNYPPESYTDENGLIVKLPWKDH